jgi:peptidoglycan/xylan/chitin deacetylase (PgdA/CDA1 family)
MIRAWIKAGASNFLARSGVDRIFRRRELPVVVGYHRVVEDFVHSARTSIPSMLVSVRMLERHLDWIGRRYRFVDLDELGAAMESGEAGRMAAVTFDDGYQDFYELALPLLQRKGIPAAVFVVTGHVGTECVHLHDKLYLLLVRRERLDAYRGVRRLIERVSLEELRAAVAAMEVTDPLPAELVEQFRSLSWEQLARVQASGFTVGSHTCTHVLMTNETAERVRNEAAESRRDIQSSLGAAPRHFAYPSGRFDTAAVRAVAEAGYSFGFTTCTHRNRVYPNLTIPRTLLWEKSSLNSVGAFSGAVLDCQIHHAFGWLGGCPEHHAIARGGTQ